MKRPANMLRIEAYPRPPKPDEEPVNSVGYVAYRLGVLDLIEKDRVANNTLLKSRMPLPDKISVESIMDWRLSTRVEASVRYWVAFYLEAKEVRRRLRRRI